jgi:hypothetical protein
LVNENYIWEKELVNKYNKVIEFNAYAPDGDEDNENNFSMMFSLNETDVLNVNHTGNLDTFNFLGNNIWYVVWFDF